MSKDWSRFSEGLILLVIGCIWGVWRARVRPDLTVLDQVAIALIALAIFYTGSLLYWLGKRSKGGEK